MRYEIISRDRNDSSDFGVAHSTRLINHTMTLLSVNGFILKPVAQVIKILTHLGDQECEGALRPQTLILSTKRAETTWSPYEGYGACTTYSTS